MSIVDVRQITHEGKPIGKKKKGDWPPPIGKILAHEDPASAVRQLVDLANENGGSDNVTVQIAALIGADDGATSKSAKGDPTG